ncbi:MAG TPA: transglutaminase domain-containing protein [Candidatus Kapabacteria bacterium]|nr:transglutaminase domain-containing protein [Candidatus Kapabacteria bacterium]
MGTRYDWAGSRIMPYPMIVGRRKLRTETRIPITTDIRDFALPPNRIQILDAFGSLKILDPMLPKQTGSFDTRARKCWQFIAGIPSSDNGTKLSREDLTESIITYQPDSNRLAGSPADFWQMPAETMARGAGDCEDLAILLASLTIGTGISPYCIRIVLGNYLQTDGTTVHDLRAHAWVVYKTENGPWALIDPTWSHEMYLETGWYAADGSDDGITDKTNPLLKHQYTPLYAFNSDHAWEVHPLGSI